MCVQICTCACIVCILYQQLPFNENIHIQIMKNCSHGLWNSTCAWSCISEWTVHALHWVCNSEPLFRNLWKQSLQRLISFCITALGPRYWLQRVQMTQTLPPHDSWRYACCNFIQPIHTIQVLQLQFDGKVVSGSFESFLEMTVFHLVLVLLAGLRCTQFVEQLSSLYACMHYVASFPGSQQCTYQT